MSRASCLFSRLPLRLQHRPTFCRALRTVAQQQQGGRTLPEAAWPELALEEAVHGKIEGVRCRQHVNPLKKELQVPLPPPDWGAIYQDIQRPLVLDVGCGSGRFVLALSQHFRSHNFVGLDIRQKLIDRANSWADMLQCAAVVHFLMANATVSLESMLASYPGPLSLVTVQFPDPHFKARHKKRRVVQPQLVRAITARMPPGGRVFLQSDVEEAAAFMHDEFRLHASQEFGYDLRDQPLTEAALLSDIDAAAAATPSPRLMQEGADASEWGAGDAAIRAPAVEQQVHADSPDVEDLHRAYQVPAHRRQSSDDIPWMQHNPIGVPTEREVHSGLDGEQAFRVLLVRQNRMHCTGL